MINKIVKILFLILVLLVSSSWGLPAKPPLLVGNNGLLEQVACYYNGKRILYYPVSTEILWEMGVAFGTVIPDEYGGFGIFIDQFFLAQAPPEFQFFVLQHECGHVILGHVQKERQSGAVSGNGHLLHEREADMYAFRQTKAVGFTQQNYARLFATMSDERFLFSATKGVVANKRNVVAYDSPLARVARLMVFAP